MKNTDLWKYEQKPTPYTKAYNRAKTVNSGEVVFRNNRTGQMEGGLFKVNQKNKLKGNHSFFDRTRELLEHTAECVGRVFSLYEDANGNIQVYAGTGFAITPKLVVTAQHVVKPVHKDDELTLKQVYFTFTVNAQYEEEVKIGDIDVLEMEPVEKFVDAIDEFQMIGDEQWETLNDFAFLRFRQHSAPKYVLPLRPASDVNDCSVISYPGYIEESKFVEEYCHGVMPSDETKKDLKRLFETVAAGMDNFEKKIISTGKCSLHSPLGFMKHKCPTIRGTSGGLLLLSPSSHFTPYFSAVHVGGNLDIHNNVAIPVSCDSFCIEYAKAIESEEYFIKENKEHLQQYFEPCRAKIEFYCPNTFAIVFSD